MFCVFASFAFSYITLHLGHVFISAHIDPFILSNHYVVFHDINVTLFNLSLNGNLGPFQFFSIMKNCYSDYL